MLTSGLVPTEARPALPTCLGFWALWLSWPPPRNGLVQKSGHLLFPAAVGRGRWHPRSRTKQEHVEKPEIRLEQHPTLSLVDGMDALEAGSLLCSPALGSAGLLSACCLWALPLGFFASRFVLPLTLHHLHVHVLSRLSARPGAPAQCGPAAGAEGPAWPAERARANPRQLITVAWTIDVLFTWMAGSQPPSFQPLPGSFWLAAWSLPQICVPTLSPDRNAFPNDTLVWTIVWKWRDVQLSESFCLSPGWLSDQSFGSLPQFSYFLSRVDTEHRDPWVPAMERAWDVTGWRAPGRVPLQASSGPRPGNSLPVSFSKRACTKTVCAPEAESHGQVSHPSRFVLQRRGSRRREGTPFAVLTPILPENRTQRGLRWTSSPQWMSKNAEGLSGTLGIGGRPGINTPTPALL